MVYVLDTETTGLRGSPTDRVVEVAVTKLCDSSLRITPVYSAVIHHPDIEKFRDAWVFRNTDLSVDDVRRSMKTVQDVAYDLRRILHNRDVTAYNTAFDFDKNLYREPWNLKGEFHVPYDIMERATNLVRHMAKEDSIKDKELQEHLLDEWEEFPEKWVRAIDAYEVLCPDDPAHLDGIQTHRASTDTVQEACILRACIRHTCGVDNQD